MPAKAIAVANLKGGVGKTTTAFLLCLGAIMRGQTVAAIDLDPSGGLSRNLGLQADNVKYTVLDVLVDEKADITQALVPSKLTGGGIVYGLMYDERISQIGAININNFQKAIDNLRDSVDYIIIDTQPELNALVPPLAIADKIIIPTKASLNDISVSAQTIKLIQELGRLEHITGVVVTDVKYPMNQKIEAVINLLGGLKILLQNPKTEQQIVIPYGKNWLISQFLENPNFTQNETQIIENMLIAVDTYTPPSLVWPIFLKQVYRFLPKDLK